MKVCGSCKIEKDLEEFYKSKNHHDGRQGYCKECSRAKRKKYREDHKEWFNREWREMMKDPKKKQRIRKQQNAANKRYRKRLKDERDNQRRVD